MPKFNFVHFGETEEAAKKYLKVQDAFSTLDAETNQRKAEHISDKNFFLADSTEMFPGGLRSGEVHRAMPMTSQVDMKYQEYMAGEFPSFQVVPPGKNKSDRDLAERAEGLIYDIMYLNEMESIFSDQALEQSIIGTAGFTQFFDPADKRAGKSGTVRILPSSLLRLRVGFKSNDWREIENFITTKRFTPADIKRVYGIDVAGTADSETASSATLEGWGGATGNDKTFPISDEAKFEADKSQIPMTTIINYWDAEENILVIGNYISWVKHNYGFVPLYLVRNITIPNEPWGRPDHFWAKDAQRSFNFLMTKAEAIIRYQAGPILLDIGNALQGRKLPAGNNVVVPIAEGKELKYLEWHGQFYPVLEQIKYTKGMIHDLTSMPESAFGSYQAGVSSGFQLQVQLQPTFAKINKKRVEWNLAFRKIIRDAFILISKFDKEADLPDGMENLRIKVIWKDSLPRDRARTVQNIAMMKKLNLMSDYTSMEEYGFDAPEEEKDRIQQEQKEKTLLAVELQNEAVKSQQAVAGNIAAKSNPPTQPGATAGEVIQNAPSPEKPLEEEQRAYPEGGAERVAPSSLGTE